MELEVKWFLSALVENELLTMDQGMAVNERLGGSPDLMTYAQDVINELCANMPEDQAQEYVGQFQQVMEYAQAQAAAGAEPEMFQSSYAAGQAQEADPDAAGSSGSDLGFDENVTEVPSLRNVSKMSDKEVEITMKKLLLSLRYLGASDLHLSAGTPMFIRRNLCLERIDEEWRLPDEDIKRLVYSVLSPEQQQRFEKEQDMSLGLELGSSRFRTSLMYHKQGMAAEFRLVPNKILSLEELGFFPQDAKTIRKFLDYNNGLILVTGPLGSGKTTTLASMIEVCNNNREDHVITVEDPIEILQHSKKCQITQREIGSCTKSYHSALKGALREDPDIIVIGEMHDLETIENAITASETGHLVIGTLHTCDASNTLNRILDVFPPAQQTQIRTMVAGSLRGVVCQQLVPKIGGGLTIAYEILVATIAISNNIGEGKIHQLKASIQIGSKSGMCTMDQNLLAKFQAGQITADTALYYMRDSSIISQVKNHMAVEEAKKLKAIADAKKKR